MIASGSNGVPPVQGRSVGEILCGLEIGNTVTRHTQRTWVAG